ncbi:MAG: serine/threonine protein kinase [Actinobacteria bacterium]|nr:serine/threonine protein kinase [Actinomycetota bacterium]
MARAPAETFAGGRYTVGRLLGRGGMAAVYLAQDGDLERPVAIKVLSDQYAYDDEFADRFRREAQTAAKLAHPNIVQVYDTGEDEGRLYIVMKYIEGEGLDEILAREGRLEVDTVLGLADQACAGLQYAHEQRVVHRDVKPANLLLRQDGTLKIADFGIARAGEATQLTQVGTILGTLNYLAPEQARGDDVSTQADIYSLGAVLYELFTGEPPRRFENVAQLATLGEEAPRPVRELAPDVPAAAEAAVMRCLARNPAYRPASAAELADELRGEATASAPTIPLPARTNATVPMRERRASGRAFDWRPLALLAVLIAVVAVVAVLVLNDNDAGSTPPVSDQIDRSDDALEQARNVEEWLRDHTEPRE